MSDSSIPPPPATTEWRISDDLRVAQLRSNIWIHTSWKTYPNGFRFSSNGLIIRSEGELTIVDTAWGVEETVKLLQWLEEEFESPLVRAVITHAHDDRLAGVSVLVDKAIPVFAESRTVRTTLALHGIQLSSFGRLEVDESIQFGELQIYFPGGGHSADNVVVWIPTGQTLFGGCLLKATHATTLGNTNDADLANWPAAVALVQERFSESESVVPGHGDAGGIELMTHTKELLQEFQDKTSTLSK